MRSKWAVFAALVALLAVAAALVVWRGPDWHAVHDAFTAVSWPWVAVAIGLNLLSVVARSFSWDTCIKQSIEPPHPEYPLVFSAFCVGLFANAVLPGRVGEIARAAVLRRRMPGRKGTTATLIGSVFAHRMFDLFPTITLVVWVLIAADIPTWAYLTLGIAIGIGVLLFATAVVLAHRQHRELDSLGSIRQLLARARQGLAIMRKPVAALKATAFQYAGWFCQLLAVWAAMRAFQIDEPLAAAGLVLVLMNVATIVPLWPGNVGLVQVAVATPLVNYGIAYAHGIAFGIGLQAIEACVGIGIGLVFLAREGLSFATLRHMEDRDEDTLEDVTPVEHERARSRVAG
ncbi:MAG TPA: lysylphosphatidylglycerol synthase transmembrane domain-containing protein [Gaiellaceae bacterium]|nr:lysylphosphatidylglycerol synthase transmembrane domain-containing protein [Gaiellaceae bacterium]